LLYGNPGLSSSKDIQGCHGTPRREGWLAAIAKEQQALDMMDCFGPPQQLPDGFKATTTGYLSVEKQPGNIKKARHVYRFTMFNGVYEEQQTYSPVVDKVMMRTFLAEAMARGMVIEQADASNAYLNARMDEEVYIRMPKGFYEEGDMVRRLKGALYGHPRSGQLWYRCLENQLQHFDMVQSGRDMCWYRSQDNGTWVIFHVDDFLAATDGQQGMEIFMGNLSRKFRIKRMGFPQQFVGIEIYRPPQSNFLILHQHNYIMGMAQKFGVKQSAPAPMTKYVTAEDEGSSVFFDFQYDSLIGAILLRRFQQGWILRSQLGIWVDLQQHQHLHISGQH
jgi:hypothetical protein